MRNLIFILTILPNVLFGQTATFSADTTRFYKERNSRKDIYDKIMEAEWKIQGQILHYGSKPVTIKTDNVIDTIFYKHRSNSETDTIICNINKTGNFIFIYNECCGAFNVADKSGKFFEGSVIFKIKGQDKRPYLGTLGETGILVNTKGKDTLRSGCRSAMSPNVYELTLGEIEICKDTVDCTQVTCLYEKGQQELNYEFGYNTISEKLRCLFLPLSNQPILVIYDPLTNKIRIE